MKTRIKRFYKRFIKVIRRSDMKLLPGQLAFFMVLAIVPTLTLLTYGASVLNLSMDFIYSFLEKAFSNDVARLLLSTSSIVEYGNSGKIDSVGLELKMLDKAYVRENYDRYKHLSIYQLFSVKNNSDKPLLIGTVYSTDSAELQEVSSSKNKLTNYSTYVSYKTPSGEKKTQDCGFFSKGGGFDSPAISETAYIIKPGETKNAYISCTIENWKDSLGTFDNISGYVVGDMFDKEAIGFRAPTGYSSMVELNKGE